MPCHSDLNALVSRPARVFLKKIWFATGIVFLVIGGRFSARKKREEEKGKEERGGDETREMWLILQAKRLIFQVPLQSPG